MNLDSLISEARGRVYAHNGVDMNAVVDASREEIASMVVEKVQFALEQAILGAQSILRSTCERYVEALYIADDLTIAIRRDAEFLEFGYDRREQLEDLLSSKSAKISNAGDRYAVVPIGQTKDSDVTRAINKKTSDLLTKGTQVKASKQTLDQMVKDMKSLISRSSNAATTGRKSSEKSFRTASDKHDSTEQWVHPGFQGVNQLEFINSQLRTAVLEETVSILEYGASKMR